MAVPDAQDDEFWGAYRTALGRALGLLFAGDLREAMAEEMVASVAQKDRWRPGAGAAGRDDFVALLVGGERKAREAIGFLAEHAARRAGFSNPVAVPLGCLVGALAELPIARQLRIIDLTIDALGRGLGLQGHGPAAQTARERATDPSVEAAASPFDLADELVNAMLRDLVTVCFAIVAEAEIDLGVTQRPTVADQGQRPGGPSLGF
jgi:hypothetical protein